MLKYLYFFKNIFNIFFLLGTEYLYFLYHKDYNKLIENNIYNINNINILYIKLFQSLAYNNKIIDDTINKHIIKYTNNVPFLKSDIDESLLINLQQKFNLIYENNNYIPINSGLISLIFKAKKSDGKNIILKIKRKNIDIKLNTSIEEISYLLDILYLFPFIKKLKIKDIFDKNMYLLKEQLNFNLEVNNIQKFKKIFLNMMEYILGKELNNLDMNNILLKKVYSKIILKMSILTFLSGYIHGDLHSGNILFIEEEIFKICLLDFGIVLKINTNIINLLLTTIEDLYEKEVNELSINLLHIIINNYSKLYKKELKIHSDNLLKIISEIIHNIKIKNKEYNIFHYFKCIQLIINYVDKHNLNRYDIYLNDDFYKLNLSLIMSSSIIKNFCDTELFVLMNDVCNELFHINFF
jgi:predicted unusual protein kinase regulating ubiquinone biosynthesis (AarF/ABC1/UbiB family)